MGSAIYPVYYQIFRKISGFANILAEVSLDGNIDRSCAVRRGRDVMRRDPEATRGGAGQSERKTARVNDAATIDSIT